MKKLISLLLVLTLSAAILAGCGKKQQEEAYVPTGDALIMNEADLATIPDEREPQMLTLGYDPSRSLNPMIGNDLSNRVLFSLLYQGLFATSSDNEAFPILCSHYQVSSDNRTYTFYLDKHATFSDGSHITGEDLMASYEFAKQKSPYYKGRFVHVLSMESVHDDSLGEDGIRIVLSTAYQDFAMLQTIPILKAEELESDFPLGTGPYVLKLEEDKASMVRNHQWWCDVETPARAEVINLVAVSSQADLRDEFEFGDVSLAVANPLSDSFAEYSCDYELWNNENGYMLYIGVNVQYSDYFKDGKNKNFRQNLTYALDRDTIIANNFRDKAFPATLAASPGSMYYNDSLAEKYAYNDLKFLEAIAGFTPNKDDHMNIKKMRLLVNVDDSARLRTARDIAETLTNMGIPTGTLEYGSHTDYSYEDLLRSHNWDLYLGKTRLSPNMDLSPFFKGYGNLYFGGLTNDDLYAMCQETLADRGNYYNLHQMLAEDGRIVPILFGYDAVYAKRGVFENFQPSRDNVFFYTIGKTLSEIQIKTVYN